MIWEIAHIPEKESAPKDSTVNILASILEPKLANTLMRVLGQISPLENLRHVKRIRRRQNDGKSELSIILCPLFEDASEIGRIPDDVQMLIDCHSLSPFIAKVPMHPATSKEEWEEQCRLWPTSYHLMANCNYVSGFSEEESLWIISCMKSTIKISKLNQIKEQVVNTALIVDPASRQIIASAVDQRPIRTDCAEEFVEKWVQHHAGHPLKHAAMVAIESSAARDRRLFPIISSESNDSTSSLGSPHKKQRMEESQEDLKGRPYLCTGYDIFLAWEPCPMCAMALVHQRVRRVFFAFPNHNAGAVCSVFRLQGQKSLNHHYSVFRVLAAH